MISSSQLQAQLGERLQHFCTQQAALGVERPHLLLALSGGVDSVTLLHALKACQAMANFTLSAMHVHHGLSPHADDWLQSCQSLCHSRSIPFYYERVTLDVSDGLGVEAIARAARYQALRQTQLAVGAHAIVTAHHVQDQAETLLLQLLRGAGVKGLSAMAEWDAHTCRWRPWLTVTKEDILNEALTHQLHWVEDESNASMRYDRNFLRHEVLPQLRQRYPQVDLSFARAAHHLAEAQVLLDIMAQQDMVTCELESTWGGQSLSMQAMQALGEVRAKNMLRSWIAQQCLLMPSTAQLQAYWQQLQSVKSDRYLHLPLYATPGKASAFLHHYQGRLYCISPPPNLPDVPFIWSGEASQRWGGWQVQFTLVKGRGISLQKLGVSPAAITLFKRYRQPFQLPSELQLQLHKRLGGESLQPDLKRPTRSLKTIFQMLAIPPWQRAYQALVSVHLNQASSTLIGLLPHTIDGHWQAGRNAFGLVIELTPLSSVSD